MAVCSGNANLAVYQAYRMFRIAKGYEQVTKTIRIPEPVAEQLDKLAAENNISFNQLVNQCIQFALSSQDNRDDAQ